MKIKIKIKSLIMIIVLTLFLVLIVAPLVNLEIANFLSKKGSQNAQAFYENYMASPIKINKKQGLYKYGENLIKGYEKFQIKFNGWGGGERTTPENMNKAMEIFQSILSEDKKNDYESQYSAKAYIKLLDTSIATLDMDKFIYWIDWAKDNENKDIEATSKIYQAYYYFVERDYEKAKEILENFDSERRDKKYYQLMGTINLHLGETDKAKESYENLWENEDLRNMEDYYPYFGGSNSNLWKDDIGKLIGKSQGKYRVKGKVSHNGKGLPFVDVYISPDIGVFYMGGKIPDAVTDKNGEFQTLPLKQGVYELGIELHPSQLYDRVFLKKHISSIQLDSDLEFDFKFTSPLRIKSPKESVLLKEEDQLYISWDKVVGADYYMVESLAFLDPKEKTGGSGTLTLNNSLGQDKFKDTNMKLSLDALDKQISVIGYEGEEEKINSTAILGSYIPGIEYPIIVNAYDKEDNLLGSSLTLISDYEDLTSFEIGGDLTKGEKLILDKRYDEAISYFKDKLNEYPKDKEALFYLTRFYSLGWEKDKIDISQAIEYAQIYDKNYSDYNLTLGVIESIYPNEIKENKELIKRVLDSIPEKDRRKDYYDTLAVYYLVQDEYKKAGETYQKALEEKSINLFYINLYLEEYGKAIAILDSGQIALTKMNSRKLIKLLKNIDSASKEDIVFLKELLKDRLSLTLSLGEEQAIYNKTLRSINSVELKDIIREIGKEEYWDQDY